MDDTAYDGEFGIPISFTFTPTSGTPFGTAQAQAQELTPADHKVDTPKFTPISGSNSGQEQYVLGKTPISMVAIKATYKGSEHATAEVCLSAKVKGTLVISYGDGATDTYTGAALTGIKPSAINADGLRTDELSFTTPLPSVFAAA